MNGGGVGVIAEFLLQMISPYTSLNIYTSLRATQSIKKNYRGLFKEINECRTKSQFDILNNVKSINYGNITEEMSELSIDVNQRLRKKSDEIRKSLKHKKKANRYYCFYRWIFIFCNKYFTQIFTILWRRNCCRLFW
jgi:hypothetical protein